VTRFRQGRVQRRLVGLVVLAAVAGCVAAFASPADAKGKYAPGVSSCPAESLVQPFQQWNDQGYYFLAPDGAFEQKPSDWHFTGRVQTVKGNESYYVNSAADSHSLWFGPNSYAQSPDICVSVYSPTIRVFTLNTGDPGSTLTVTLNYTDQNGQPQSSQIAALTGGASWQPTDSLLFLNNIAPIVGGQSQTWVSFTFHVVGPGNWQIDDFYIDPIKNQTPASCDPNSDPYCT